MTSQPVMPRYSGAGLRDVPPDRLAPTLAWDDFMTYVLGHPVHGWRQNQHVALIGPTDSGKSTMTYAILPLRRYTTFFATKPRDLTLESYARSGGFTTLDSWPPRTKYLRRPVSAERMPRRMLWPDASSLRSGPYQRAVFAKAFDDIYDQGCWCTVWDEFWMMTQILDLEDEARIFLQQARSNDIAFVMGMQRPSRIPLEAFDQSTHLMFWRDNDERNLSRIGGIGWLASGPIRAFVANLEPYQVLYINSRRGWMYRTRAPELALPKAA